MTAAGTLASGAADQAGTNIECPSALQLVRGVAVMLGGSVVLAAAAGAGTLAFARALGRRRPPSPAALAAVAGAAAYARFARPWILHWGAAPGEGMRPLPGSKAPPGPVRAVTIDAPVETVWPWLAQIGQDRGGFYSYEWLENLAGCRMQNADRIHSEWQHRDLGDTVRLHPAYGLPVAYFEPNRAIELERWGSFEVQPTNGGQGTRLIARNRASRGLAEVLYTMLLEVPHFVMERKMLLGIKARAERATAN
jgi:hypothetical protein